MRERERGFYVGAKKMNRAKAFPERNEKKKKRKSMKIKIIIIDKRKLKESKVKNPPKTPKTK